MTKAKKANPTKKKKFTATSVSFKRENLIALREHPLHKDNDQSVSWIVNRLVEKLLNGEITITLQ